MGDQINFMDAEFLLPTGEGGDAIPSHEASETWSRLLALDEGKLRASIRACESYLVSPEGIAEFGLVERLPEAKRAQIYDEALHRSEMMRTDEWNSDAD